MTVRKSMESFIRFLVHYRENSKAMILYPLFLTIKDRQGWEVQPNSDYGDCIIFIPGEQWDESLGRELEKVISTIPGLKMNGMKQEEDNYYIDVNDMQYRGSFLDDMHYLAWLWDPVRKPTIQHHIVNGHRFLRTSDRRILNILKRASPVIVEPTQEMCTHPLWPLYLQIESRRWQMYSDDFTGNKYWLVFSHKYGDGVDHPAYNPATHVVHDEVPEIIEWMDLHRHPILYMKS